MNTPQKFRLTEGGKTCNPKDLKPSEKILILGLKIAEHECPDGVEKSELQQATGLVGNSFDRAWTCMLKNKLVERKPKR